MIVSGSLRALALLEESTELVDKLRENADYFRRGLTGLGFEVGGGDHPILPVMLGDARLAQEMAADLLDRGVYVKGFFYPVVPKGQARIRVQISAAHGRDDLDFALQAFGEAAARF